MALLKCPRCELNYMKSNEEMCKVCYREIHGKLPQDEVELCSTCNEAPALLGRDVCLYCLREMNKQKGIKEDLDEPIEIGLDPVSGMEEIIPEMGGDDPDFHAIGDALSLEEMSEQEDKDDEDEDLDD